MEQTKVKKRSALSPSEKEEMMAVLLRNTSLFTAVRETLKPEDFSEVDTKYAVVWKVACDFYDKYQKLPGRNSLMARVDAVLDDNPDVLNDVEVSDLEAFIDVAYDKDPSTWDGEDLKNSEHYAQLARDSLKFYLEERLWSKINVTGSHKGRIVVGSPEILLKFSEQALRLESLAEPEDDSFFHDGWDVEGGINIFPTRLSFFDNFLGGGQAPGEAYGVMGPFGSCKTTLGVMLAVEGARTAQEINKDNPDDEPYVFLFSYEARKAELRLRSLSYAARIERHSLESMGKKGLSGLSTKKKLKKYEKEMFAGLIADGKTILGELGRAKRNIPILDRFIIPIDLTGYDKKRRGGGSGYIQEIARIVATELRRRGPKARALMVIVDYVGLMAKRYNAAAGKDEKALRHAITDSVGLARNMIADQFNCPIWMIHQLSGEANKKTPGARYHYTDAAEAKNFAENLDFSFIVSSLTDKGLGQITSSKHRRTGAMPPAVIQVQGQFNTVVDRSSKYMVDPQTRTITEKDLASSAVKSHKKDGKPAAPEPSPDGKKSKKPKVAAGVNVYGPST